MDKQVDKDKATGRPMTHRTCYVCNKPLRFLKRDQRCMSGREYVKAEDAHYMHRACFNAHRKDCRACWMMTGEAGR